MEVARELELVSKFEKFIKMFNACGRIPTCHMPSMFALYRFAMIGITFMF